MPKDIIFEKDVRDKIREGVSTLANAVKVTLGPKGRNVIIGKGVMYNPIVTKDGVSVAREVELKDPLANIGAQVVKYVAAKAADKVGDGTTTSTVLTQAIYEQGLKLIEKGVNPVDIKKGIDEACSRIVDYLQKHTVSIKLEDEFAKRVAVISSNNDERLGSLIYEAFNIVGPKGAVIVENANSLTTELKQINGFQYDRGYINAAFSNDRSTLSCNLSDARILVTDKQINTQADLRTLLKLCDSEMITNLLIICEDMADEALQLLIANAQRGLNVCVTKPAWIGQSKVDFLQDIATFTGATIISDNTKTDVKTINLSNLGSCKKATITKDETIIRDGGGIPEIIQTRIEQVTDQAEREEDSFDKEKLVQRISKLSGKMASIEVGAATEFEQKEIADRVDDAIRATKSALNKGVFVGGGIGLINAREEIAKDIDNLPKDLQVGFKVVIDACASPFVAILENAGIDPKETYDVIGQARQTSDRPEYIGYNVVSSKVENLFEAGVIDPVEVTITAITTACSAASMLLTSDCMINEVPKANPYAIKGSGLQGMV